MNEIPIIPHNNIFNKSKTGSKHKKYIQDIKNRYYIKLLVYFK